MKQSLLEISEEFTLDVLERLKNIQKPFIKNPGTLVSMSIENEWMQKKWLNFYNKSIEWIDENLPEAYLKGIEKADKTAQQLGVATTAGPIALKQILSQSTGGGNGGNISNKAAQVLKSFPKHHTMYSVFQEAAKKVLSDTRFPIIRQHQDRIRNITIEVSNAAYQEGNVYTRRKLSQQLMRKFSDEGIRGVIYQDGRMIKLDTYSEMVARSQTSRAANQANLNRLQERGIDTILVSQHSPCSDLCFPWQGEVLSQSGNSDEYPSLDEAVSAGLLHPNCKHTFSGFVEGVSEKPEKVVSEAENSAKYEQQQKQRYNERQIREWKRREISAIDPQEREKASKKIREWQARNRQHIEKNDYLRRDYTREKVN